MTTPTHRALSPATTADPVAGGPIYLDYNATTPVDPRVLDALLPYLGQHFGNPSSTHHYGGAPSAALARAREQVAALIGGRADDIAFTGSGSEADSPAIRGTVLHSLIQDSRRWDHARPHLVTQVTEHPAVLQACRSLQRLHQVDVTYLSVDADGILAPHVLAAAMTEHTVLVTVMHANNETGVLQPITELARTAHSFGALFHTDAAQTVGKIPVDVDHLDVDLLTLVGHKMYAPKGIAALYRRDQLPLEPLVPGGGQERGLRAGTENVALAVALGAAADLAQHDLDTGAPARLAVLRDRLHHELSRRLPDRVHLNGHPDRRLPHTLNISIDGINSDGLLAGLPELAASTGSACHSADPESSPVLQAMGLAPDCALGAIRLSLGRWTTDLEVSRVCDLLAAAVPPLLAEPSAHGSP
jgi:cysteine desulfurase